MPKRQIRQAIIEEVDGAIPDPPVPKVETSLTGLDFTSNISTGQGSSKLRRDRQPSKPVRGGRSASASSTTDFDFLAGANSTLLGSAFATQHTEFDYEGATIEAISASNVLRNSAGWGGLTGGQKVVVSGAPFNPLFLASILSVDGNDLYVDPDFIALPDQPSGDTIAVHQHAGFRLGTLNRKFTYEKWNPLVNKGVIARDCLVNSWGFQLTYGDNPSALQQTFGISAKGGTDVITAELPNDIVLASEVPPFSSGSGFQGLEYPDLGLGFRYNGAVMDDLHLNAIQAGITNPTLRLGGAGHNEPLKQILDGSVAVNLSITFDVAHEADEQAWEILRHDASGDPDAREFVAIGFGGLDDLGRVFYMFFPELMPTSVTDPGTAETGADDCTITYQGYAHPDFTAISLFFFDAI